jgi:hypothetical protein
MVVLRPTWPIIVQARKKPMLSTQASERDMSTFPVSPLTLSHQLLQLAEQADRAGLPQSARSLLKLAQRVCVDRPRLASC